MPGYFIVCQCVCIVVRDPIIRRGRVRKPLTDLTLENVCARPSPGLGFVIPYVVPFLCSLIWGERWLLVLLILLELLTIAAQTFVTLYFILLSSLWHYENVCFLIPFFNLKQNKIHFKCKRMHWYVLLTYGNQVPKCIYR